METVENSFDILERIGKGSFGAVYKALDKSTGQVVALKRILLEPNFIKEIVQEIKILEQCDSPYIVKYYQHYIRKERDGPKWDDYFYISMEYCALGSVGDIVEVLKQGLDEVYIAAICSNVLKGLNYLFQNRKIHRDIKPDNILLTEKGEPKLGDFGVAGVVSSVSSRRNTMAGTPYYIAPEVLDERQTGYDFKADIWSLGISAIEMAEQQPPLYGIPPLKVLTMIPKRDPPTLKNPNKYSLSFREFLLCMLIKDPQQRWSSEQLLAHPFLLNVDPIRDLASLVSQVTEIIKHAGSLEQALLAPVASQKNQEPRMTVKAIKVRQNSADWAEISAPTDNDTQRHAPIPKRKGAMNSFSNLNFDEPVEEVGSSSGSSFVGTSKNTLRFALPPPPPPDGFVGIYRAPPEEKQGLFLRRKPQPNSFRNLDFDAPVEEVGVSQDVPTDESVNPPTPTTYGGAPLSLNVTENVQTPQESLPLPPEPTIEQLQYYTYYQTYYENQQKQVQYQNNHEFYRMPQYVEQTQTPQPTITQPVFNPTLSRSRSNEHSQHNPSTPTHAPMPQVSGGGSFNRSIDLTKERRIQPPHLDKSLDKSHTGPKKKEKKKEKGEISKSDKKQIMGVLYN